MSSCVVMITVQLTLVTPVFFKETFNIDVRVTSEVIALDANDKTITIRDQHKVNIVN